MPHSPDPTLITAAAPSRRRILAGALATAVAPVAVRAQQGPGRLLRVGLSAEPTTLDPQFFNSTANDSLSRHVYERLVDTDDAGRIVPGVAESWRLVDELTWEFRLRSGVVFHDGSPLMPEDVVFSMERGCCLPNSPFSLGTYIRGKTFSRADDRTVRVVTDVPTPTMLEDMSRVSIVGRSPGPRSTADYNAGNGHPGTGPYRVTERTPGSQIVLEASPGWWGGQAAWPRVLLRVLASDSSRLATLLAGEVDVIDAVPPSDVVRVSGSSATAISQAPSNRMVHLRLDSTRQQSPFVRANDGSALPDNPLRNVEVRRALWQAIDRQAIVARVMDGLAIPATQFAAEGQPDFAPGVSPMPYDPQAARARLRAAGYPEGFTMVLHSPNDRLVNDARVALTVAQMFTRVGVRTTVEAMPSSTFFPRANRAEFSVILTSWGLYDMVTTARANLHTPNLTKGMGVSNSLGYSDPTIDHLIGEAMTTIDEGRRRTILQEVTKRGMEDVALIPIHHQVNVWGTRRGLRYQGRSDGTTVAQGVLV
jgi:peptide/nickel transport system substrate-binding protein